MKKRILAVVLCVAMVAAMVVGCGGKEEAPALPSADEVTFDVEATYEPNAEYDKFTVFEYTIEAIEATFVVTLSSNMDETEMEIHCEFYGDEQLAVVEKDGDSWKVTQDKTGFMEGDAPAIIQKGQDANNWAAISK